jgi:hypothetical protein
MIAGYCPKESMVNKHTELMTVEGQDTVLVLKAAIKSRQTKVNAVHWMDTYLKK